MFWINCANEIEVGVITEVSKVIRIIMLIWSDFIFIQFLKTKWKFSVIKN